MTRLNIPDWSVRHIVIDLTKRRIAARYRGSFLGLAWSIMLPLAMLLVYSLVFNHFLGLRWPGAEAEGGLAAALRIYLGLITLNFVAENLTTAPGLVLENPSFVKKIVFPLPVLAYVAAAASSVQLIINLFVASALAILVPDAFPVMLLLAPLVLLPLFLWVLAAHWWLAALGVYIRDLVHIMGPVVTALLFLSPVFYSIEHLASRWRILLMFNPLSLPIEQLRALLFDAQFPDLWPILLSSLAALVAALLGRILFQRLQPGFADVV